MNLCVTCGEDFSSVKMFDWHRVGPHDGERRCLDLDEIAERGWQRDTRGRWFDPEDAAGVRARFAAREKASLRSTVAP